jgi:hypothetical protein
VTVTTPKVYLSRRNLLTLLSKLDRFEAGETTECSIIKYRNDCDPFQSTIDSVKVTAVADDAYYVGRAPGPVDPRDNPDRLDDDMMREAMAMVVSMVGPKHAQSWWGRSNKSFNQLSPREQWLKEPKVVHSYLMSGIA